MLAALSASGVRQPAIREHAAVDRGMERLDPAVEHLGEPVTAATSVTGRPASRSAGRAAGRDQLEALGDQPAGEVDQAVLVGHRQQRPPRHRDPVAASA